MADASIILANLPARKAYKGISTALGSLHGMGACLADSKCAEAFFGMGSLSQWKSALDLAAQTLVYHDGDMALGGGVKYPSPNESVVFGKAVDDGWEKEMLGLPPSPVPGAICTMDAIYTSTKQDRDGDVLESSGAELDPMAPLLWQHIPIQPIGRNVRQLTQSKKFLTGQLAIADIPLGRDAAVLVEFGALRISHGFKPLEYAPLDTKDKTGESGFHVTKFQIFEISLVSVPSNVQAVITAFSRQKLHHPLVKAWSKELWDKVPENVRGGYETKCSCQEHKEPITKISDNSVADEKAAVPYAATPLAPEDMAWDWPAADKLVRAWAGVDGDKPTAAQWGKYKQAFSWFDATAPDTFAAYKLPHHTVQGGKLVCVWRGVVAAGNAVQGARGGANIPDADLAGVKKHLGSHYAQFKADPPWEKSVMILEVKGKLGMGDKSALQEAIGHAQKAMDHSACPPMAKSNLKGAMAHVKAVLDRHDASNADDPYDDGYDDTPDDTGKATTATETKAKDTRKSMTKSDVGHLADAVDGMTKAANHGTMPPKAKDYASTAATMCKAIHDKHAATVTNPDADMDTDKAFVLAQKHLEGDQQAALLIGSLLTGTKQVSQALLIQLGDVIAHEVETSEERALEAAFA